MLVIALPPPPRRLVEQCIQQFSEPDQEEDVPSSRGNNSLLRFLVEARGEVFLPNSQNRCLFSTELLKSIITVPSLKSFTSVMCWQVFFPEIPTHGASDLLLTRQSDILVGTSKLRV